MVRDSVFSHKTDCVTQVQYILNPEGHQSGTIGSKVLAGLLNGLIFPVGGVALVKGPHAACVAGFFTFLI